MQALIRITEAGFLLSKPPLLAPIHSHLEDTKHTMSTTIGVAGITGKLGSLVTQNLLLHPSAHVRGLCRDKSKLPDSIRSNPRISIVEGDSSNVEAARSAVRGCSAVICCYLGSNDLMIEGQKVLIDACIAENVPRYIPSDYTLDYRPLQPKDIPSKEPMFRIVEYLEGKSIKVVHLLIGCFVQTWWTFLGIWHPEEYKLTFWGTGDDKWEFSTYNNAAQRVAEVALDSSATGFLKCEPIILPKNLSPPNSLSPGPKMPGKWIDNAPNSSWRFHKHQRSRRTTAEAIR